MYLSKVVILGLAGILAAWGQTITVEPGQIAGIELVGSQSAAFQGLFQDAAEPQDAARPAVWLPFTVVLRNHSPRAVVAYHVRWTVDGRLRWMADDRNVEAGMDSRTDPFAWVRPGSSVVVAPGAAAPFVLLPDGASQPLLASLESAGTVTVSVDSVLFANGEFAGPDLGGNFERDAASFAGRREVNAEVQSELAAGQTFDKIAAGLAETANRRPNGQRDWNAAARASQARALLRRYQRSGAQATVDFVQEQLREPEIVVHC